MAECSFFHLVHWIMRGLHPAFKVMQQEADAEPGKRIKFADVDFSAGFAAGLRERNGDVGGVGSGESCTSVPQMHRGRMIAVPCAIGNGNGESGALPGGDCFVHGSLKVPKGVQSLRARTVIQKGELKALGEPPGLPDHRGGRALHPVPDEVCGTVVEDDVAAVETCRVWMTDVIEKDFVPALWCRQIG